MSGGSPTPARRQLREADLLAFVCSKLKEELVRRVRPYGVGASFSNILCALSGGCPVAIVMNQSPVANFHDGQAPPRRYGWTTRRGIFPAMQTIYRLFTGRPFENAGEARRNGRGRRRAA